MGWFEGSSTRTPTTLNSCTWSPAPLLAMCDHFRDARVCPNGCCHSTAQWEATRTLQGGNCARQSEASGLPAEERSQPGLNQGRVQPHGQRGDLACGFLRSCARFRVALPDQRRDDLLDQAELSVCG